MFEPIASLDQSLFWLINGRHTLVLDHFFSIITNLGTGWVIAPIILFFIFKQIPAARRVSVILFSLIIMIASGLINSQVKQSFRTPRPSAYFSQEQLLKRGLAASEAQSAPVKSVHVVGERLMQNSFPSGHTNTAFSAAMLMALCFGRKFWPAFCIAVLVGYSRVYMGAHFPSDVIAGALLGCAVVWIGFMLYIFLKRRGTSSNDQR